MQASGAFQTANDPPYDAFVTKLNAAGSGLVYSTYLGGSGFEQGIGIAVDSAGNAYVTGYTQSTDFPTTSGAFQTYPRATAQVFVTKLNPTGSALVFSTYLGGSQAFNLGTGIAVDSAGNAYVTGYTNSANFPTTPGAYQTACPGDQFQCFTDAFVTKLNLAGSALVYSTFLGGIDGGLGIAVDSAGNAYVTGFANSIPTTNGAFQTVNAGGDDAFVTKLNAAGSGLVYSTYLGGSGFDFGGGVAVDSAGSAYVTGYTDSTNFPTTSGAFQTANAGAHDAFVTKLNAAGSGLVYSTYIGGNGDDYGQRVAVDSAGSAYVTGYTASTNFPITTGAFQTTNAGGDDAFVTKLNAAGSGLVYSSYLGGSSDDFGSGIAVDSLGSAYVTGTTDSTNFPTTSGAFQTVNGWPDAFVTKITAIEEKALVQQPIDPDGTSVFNASRGVIRVRFTLTLNGAATCQLPPATISLTRTAGGTIGPIDESVYESAADTGSDFHISGCQYGYNIAASSLGTGTYRVDISIDGSVVGSGIFGLK